MSPLRQFALRAVLLLAVIASFAPITGAQEVPDSVPAQSAPADSLDALPLRRDNGTLTPAVLGRVGGVLLLGAVLVVLAVFVLRRMLQPPVGGSGRRITVLESRRATPQLNVVLLRVDDRELLVGQSGDSVTLLHATDAADAAAASSRD